MIREVQNYDNENNCKNTRLIPEHAHNKYSFDMSLFDGRSSPHVFVSPSRLGRANVFSV